MKNPYKIAIIDYNMSNMFSIKNALDLLNYESIVTSDKNKILAADGIIIPGVGSYPEAMKELNRLNLPKTLEKFIITGKPLLGICLGFQLFLEESEEFETTKGLGFFKGRVRNFKDVSKGIKVPHIGWNNVIKNTNYRNTKDPIISLKNREHFYFVHSYFAETSDLNTIYLSTEYNGFSFTSSIVKGNIFGFQFHPEKSGKMGINLLKEIFQR